MLVPSILKHLNTILLNTLPKLNWKKRVFVAWKQTIKQTKASKINTKNGTHGSNNKQNRHLDKGKDKTIRAVHTITNHVKEPEQYRWVD